MGIFDLLEATGEEATGEEAVAMVAAKVVQPKPPMELKTKGKEAAEDQQQPKPQNYSDDGKARKEYTPKSMPAADEPQKEATPENVYAVPASESEKSLGGVAKDDSKKEEEEGPEKEKNSKDPNVKRISGAQRRKLKKKNPKEDFMNGDGSKKPTEPALIEEEKHKDGNLIHGSVYPRISSPLSIEEYCMVVHGKRFPPRMKYLLLDKIDVVDGRLLLTLNNLCVSLKPVSIHRKWLSPADRAMAKHPVEGKDWQAKHGVRFPLASNLTAEEETQTLVGLQACAYDRSGSSFVVQCKKLRSSEDLYRITSGWGDFLTRNNLIVQQDAKPEEVELVVLEVWVFRSLALEVGIRNQPKGPLGLLFIHYRQGESLHADRVIQELAAARKRVAVPELDEATASHLQDSYALLKLLRVNAVASRHVPLTD